MKGTYKQPSLVSGMSVQDILNMDNAQFNRLTSTDLRKVVGRLVSAGNKRIRTFQQSGRTSPAVSQVAASGGMFSTKGKDLNALRAEYARARNFLTSKTGTVKQYVRMRKQTVESLRQKGVSTTENRMGSLFAMYDKLKEMDPSIEERGLKYKILAEIEETLGDVEPEDLDNALEAMMDRIKELYEEEMENGDWGGVSDFFEI